MQAKLKMIVKWNLLRLICVSLIRQLYDKSDKLTEHNYCLLQGGTSKTGDGSEMEAYEVNICQLD